KLRTDVVDDFLPALLFSQRFSKPQIKAGIIHQHHCIWFVLTDFLKRFTELLAKVTIFCEHLPQTDNGRVSDPVFERRASHLVHLWSAASDKLNIGIKLAQGAH